MRIYEASPTALFRLKTRLWGLNVSVERLPDAVESMGLFLLTSFCGDEARLFGGSVQKCLWLHVSTMQLRLRGAWVPRHSYKVVLNVLIIDFRCGYG